MGNGGKVTDKGRSGGEGMGDYIQGGGSYGVAVRELDMGSYGSNVDDYRGFSSSGGQTNCGKDSSVCWGQRVGMDTRGKIPGCDRAVAHQIIHSEAAGHHCGMHGQPEHI